MIDNFKIFEKTVWTNHLLIVDVQEQFSQFFNDIYLEKLYEHAEMFSNVYQIYDTIDSDKYSYQFPNQVKTISKEYGGGEIQIKDANSYFTGETLENFLKIDNLEYLNDLEPGTNWKMNNGDYYYYIGGQTYNSIGHDWFICSEELYDFFTDIKSRNISLEVVGGAASECLFDVTTVLESLEIEYKLNDKFVYSYKGCKF